MTGKEFIRKIKILCKAKEWRYCWYPDDGKGSHGTLYAGDNKTIVRNLKDEIKTGTLHAMLKQLSITLDELNGR